MIVSTHLLGRFIDTKLPKTLGSDLSCLGLEVASDERIDIDDSVVVGLVLSAIRHKDADKLKICEVDIGEKEPLSIICGAANARAGIYVAVAKIGASVNGMKIKKAKLRGVESYGMLCSSSELGLASLPGILELDTSIDPSLPPHTLGATSPLKKQLGRALNSFSLFSGQVMEIELTPNRGDALSVLGVAKEIAALYSLPLRLAPSTNVTISTLSLENILQVSMEDGVDAHLIYHVAKVVGIEPILEVDLALSSLGILDVATSPLARLLRFVAYLCGVNISAYSYTQSGVANDEAGYNMARLHVKNLAISKEASVQAVLGSDDTLLSLVGIGSATPLPTKQVREESIGALSDALDSSCYIFEASYLAPKIVARELYDIGKAGGLGTLSVELDSTLKAHDGTLGVESKIDSTPSPCAIAQGIVDSDLVYRSTRGMSKDLALGYEYLYYYLVRYYNILAINGAIELGSMSLPEPVRVGLGELSSLLGIDIDKEEIFAMLQALGFTLEAINEDSFFLTPNLLRHDIATYQDVAEEILRSYGIDKVANTPLAFKDTPHLSDNYASYRLALEIKMRASNMGYIECVNYVFYDKEVQKELSLPLLPDELELLNPITSELNTLRSSLIPRLLECLRANMKNSYPLLKAFELGSIFDERRHEKVALAIVANNYKSPPAYPHAHGVAMDFYGFAKDLSSIIGEFSLVNKPKASGLEHDFICASVLSGGLELGYIAKLHPKVATKYKLTNCFIAEIDIAKLAFTPKVFSAIARYQLSRRDLTLLVDARYSFSEIKGALEAANIEGLKEAYVIDSFKEGDDIIALSIRLILQSNKTLEESDIVGIVERVLEVAGREFGARLKG